MNDLDSIKSALQQVRFMNVRQYASDLLCAFKIPRATIERLLSKAESDSFKSPILIYRRAIIVYDPTLKSDCDLASIGQGIEHNVAAFRLLLIFNKDYAVCKNTITEAVLKFKPNEICDYVHFFLPLIYGKANDKDLEITTNFAELVGSLFNQLCVDNKHIYSDNPGRLTDFVLTLIYLSFAKSILLNSEIENVVNWGRASQSKDYHSIISGIFNAVLLNNRQSVAFEKLPSWNICRHTVNELPDISAKSFEFAARVLCYDLANIDTEILGSLIYKLVQKGEAPCVFGHLTSYQNVAKVLNPLFVNDYVKLIDDHQGNGQYLTELRKELLGLTFFDPTNGPGSFLTAALNSIIDLVSSIDSLITSSNSSEVNIRNFIGLVDNDVSQKLCALSLWVSYLQYLHEHRKIEALDLQSTFENINIHVGSQLRTNWAKVCPNIGNTLIVGAPTFKGKIKTTRLEKDDMKQVFGTSKYGDADFCSCWLFLAAQYIGDTSSKCAFVLTNSVCQGSQVAFIWERIYNCGCKIFFAYRSFKWKNERQSTTGVSVVIVGLSSALHDKAVKHLYTNDVTIKTDTIGPYLINSTATIVRKRSRPFSKQLPKMPRGQMPYDNQNLLLSREEKDLLQSQHPSATVFLKKIVGSEEFINNVERWCLWISSDKVAEARSILPIAERIDKVKEFRLSNKDKAVRKLADRSHQFREFRCPSAQTLVIPAVSSENRPYIPMGYVGNDTIVSNLAFTIFDCSPWVFGILSSRMHMAWIRTVCGCLETRIRYSNQLGYNTFPLPEISPNMKERIDSLAHDIIGERANYCDMSLGKLYSNLPPSLSLLHGYLDEYIDRCYQVDPFNSDMERVRLLFQLYERGQSKT